MAFDSLSEKLQEAFQSLKGKGKITEDDVNLALRQVRTALLEADVNFMVAKDFVKSIKEKALGEEVFGSLNPAQTVIKIVNDELNSLIGWYTKSHHDFQQATNNYYACWFTRCW